MRESIPLDEQSRTRWAAFYEKHAPALLRFLLKLTGEHELACELMQETFLRALRADPDGSGVTSVRAWLFRIATNLAHDAHRRDRRVVFVELEHANGSVASDDDRTVALVSQALRLLPPREATTLLLHYEVGFSRAEIAEMNGVGLEAVKSRLRRGRQHFLARYRELAGVTR